MTPIARVVLSIAFASAAAAASATDARRGVFHGSVHVAADGRIRVETLDSVAGALADAVRSQLEARRALPALKDAVAVDSIAPVSGRVLLTPNGDRVDVALEGVALHPGARKRAPFSYPPGSMREERAGWVEVEFSLDADGAPADIVAVQSSHPSFAKAVSKPLRAWRFHTAGTVPGQRYRVSATFRTDAKTPMPAFACPHDPMRARLPDQPGCVDAVSVHGSYVGTVHF